MNGEVLSGGTNGNIRPLSGAEVTLFEATDGNPAILGKATTGSDGTFVINTSVTTTARIFYATADLGNGVGLMAVIGPQLPAQITINEMTTVAAVYCAAQFMSAGEIAGDAFGMRIAAAMTNNVVTLSTGASSPVLTSAPNADQTNALRSTCSLANVLALCVRDPQECAQLFQAATPPGGAAPTNTIEAMHNIACYPGNQVGGVFALSKTSSVYQPALVRQPDAWTVAVKVNDSGNDEHMFGGPGNVAFDQNGNAWIANNVVQGHPYSTKWSIVLTPTGQPAPMSPFTGGGLLGPGFGVDVDSKGNVWYGNFGWGHVNPTPTGSVSKFNLNAEPLSPDGGYQEAIYKVQGTVADPDDNIWLAGYGNNTVAVYPNGDPTTPLVYESTDTFVPFDIAIAKDGTGWVTNSYTEASGIVHLQMAGGELRVLHEVSVGKTNKGIDIDSFGNIWVASGGNDHVYAFDEHGTKLGGFQGGGINGPWGLTIDGDDNIWVADFGPLEIGSIFTGRLTKLAGANAATRPPGHDLGDAISPPTGYTLPSAGDPVLLHDGTPLYPDGPEQYIPMMRTTGVNIDQAGNVWTCNNWKPVFDSDVHGDPSNPGGDGMIIWLGLAKPRIS